MEATISISLVCSLVAVLGTLYNIYNGHHHNAQADASREIEIEKNFVGLGLKIDNLSENVRELNGNFKKQEMRMQQMAENIVHYEEQIKTLYSRVEKLEEVIARG